MRWVTDNGGVEVRSRAKVGVNIGLSSGIYRGSIVFGLVKYSLEITEPVLGNHSTNIRIGLESFDRRGKNRSGSKFLGAAHNHIVELFVLGCVNDEPFNTDAILTSVLTKRDSAKLVTARRVVIHIQDTAHPDTDISVEIGTRQDYSRVLSPKFQSQWSHVVCGSEGNLATDFLRSDECNVFDDCRLCKNLGLGR